MTGKTIDVLFSEETIAERVNEIAKEIAAEAVRRDPQRSTPGFADAVTATEQLMAGDFLELS